MATAASRFGRLGDRPERDYSPKLQLFSAFAEPELRAAIDTLRLVPGMRVVDAGCGTGETLGWLAAAVMPGGYALGMDISVNHLRAARGAMAEDTALLQADLLRPPLVAGSFDVVWSVNSVHHLDDPSAGTRALAALLRPGGQLALGQSSLLPDMYFAWDARLERSVTEAVRAYYRERYGLSEHDLTAVRSLLALLQDAGLCGISVRTFVIERCAPLDPSTRAWLLEAIFRGTWGERLRSFLSEPDYQELTRLCDPEHADFALHRPDFHFLQTFTLAVGKRLPPAGTHAQRP